MVSEGVRAPQHRSCTYPAADARAGPTCVAVPGRAATCSCPCRAWRSAAHTQPVLFSNWMWLVPSNQISAWLLSILLVLFGLFPSQHLLDPL